VTLQVLVVGKEEGAAEQREEDLAAVAQNLPPDQPVLGPIRLISFGRNLHTKLNQNLNF
jgi:hypothetical protein